LDRVNDVALSTPVGTGDDVEPGLKIQLDLAAKRLEVLNQYLAYVYRFPSPRVAGYPLI
jgi:hypothetical protein